LSFRLNLVFQFTGTAIHAVAAFQVADRVIMIVISLGVGAGIIFENGQVKLMHLVRLLRGKVPLAMVAV
jgi:hypothetical protein